MWFRRKPQNRRFIEQDELLDVKLRSDQVRAGRLRLLGMWLSITLTVLAVGLICWRGGLFLLNHFIYNNPAYAIQQIEVQTDGILSADAIRDWANVKTGDNLLALDLMRVKRDLESQPSVQTVAVERILPGTLKLRITEREPVAQTVAGHARPDGEYEQVVYHFDEDGYTMKPIDAKLQSQQPAVSYDRLPMLLGVQVNELQLGKQAESPQIRAALALLSEFDRSPMSGLVELERINVSSPEILQVTTSQGADITFSLSQFDLQFRRWRAIYDYYQKWGKAIASLDLSISNNLPVRWVAANTVQPIQPKAAKPTRSKKKNV